MSAYYGETATERPISCEPPREETIPVLLDNTNARLCEAAGFVRSISRALFGDMPDFPEPNKAESITGSAMMSAGMSECILKALSEIARKLGV